MKKIFQLSQVVVVMVMSVFLFSCEKSEMDGVVPSAQAEAKKGKNQEMNIASQSQQADSVFIVTFYDTNNTLNSEADVQSLATSIGGNINFQQTYWEGTKGFAAPLTANQVYIFRHDSRVEFVEADSPIYPTNP